MVLICNIRDPLSGLPYSRDARHIAQKAETYLKSTGIADTCYFGPEAEFFVFNGVRYGQGMNYAFHEIESEEGSLERWTGRRIRTSATSRAPRRAISPFHPPTACRICAPRWC